MNRKATYWMSALLSAFLAGIPAAVLAQTSDRPPLRRIDPRELIERFQRTPTVPNFGTVNSQRPRTGQADPMAFQRALTRINYRSLKPDDRRGEVDDLSLELQPPVDPRAFGRSGIRDLDPRRPRTELGRPLAMQEKLTSAERWRMERQRRLTELELAAAERRLAERRTFQSVNSAPRRPELPADRGYPRRPEQATHSMFSRNPSRWQHEQVAAFRSPPKHPNYSRFNRGPAQAGQAREVPFRRPPAQPPSRTTYSRFNRGPAQVDRAPDVPFRRAANATGGR